MPAHRPGMTLRHYIGTNPGFSAAHWNAFLIVKPFSRSFETFPASSGSNVPRVHRTGTPPMPLQSIALDPPRDATPSEAALMRRIDLTTLRLFIAICEEHNLTRAAAREGIA